MTAIVCGEGTWEHSIRRSCSLPCLDPTGNHRKQRMGRDLPKAAKLTKPLWITKSQRSASHSVSSFTDASSLSSAAGSIGLTM
jgi:hypothetical protein